MEGGLSDGDHGWSFLGSRGAKVGAVVMLSGSLIQEKIEIKGTLSDPLELFGVKVDRSLLLGRWNDPRKTEFAGLRPAV